VYKKNPGKKPNIKYPEITRKRVMFVNERKVIHTTLGSIVIPTGEGTKMTAQLEILITETSNSDFKYFDGTGTHTTLVLTSKMFSTNM
jgi:hypothetical protein